MCVCVLLLGGGALLSAADPAQSPSPPRREGSRESQAGRRLLEGVQCSANPSPRCARSAYLGRARQPLAVGHSGVRGPGVPAGLPRPLGLPPGPDSPEERELRPKEGHGRGPGPAHGGRRLRTSAAAQRCAQGLPAALMGEARLALRAPARRRGPRGRLAAAGACLRGTSQALRRDGHHDGQTARRTRSWPHGSGRRRPPLARAVPSQTAPPPNKPSPPPRRWRTPRGRAHTGDPAEGSQAVLGAGTGAGTPR